MDPRISRRDLIALGGKAAAAALATSTLSGIKALGQTRGRSRPRVFDVRDFGAVGDGATLDSPAIQRAIDAAAASGPGAQVLVPGGRRYLIGGIELRGGIDFHLADDAGLVVSTKREHFPAGAAIVAHEAHGLQITGTGSIDGRSREFMREFDAEDEWWRPAGFRPRLLVLTGCEGLQVRDVTLRQAPSWTLHLVGCRHALIDGITIRNQLDVPNCDGIDPDCCQDVEIRGCDIACGDDAIVIKATRRAAHYGDCSNIVVKDCTLETQDAGLKIGTETTADIHHIRFEHCRIRSSCRGLAIQLRDQGNVHDIEFGDIEFVSRYHSRPWWGRGEAISFTAIPRTPETEVGTLRDIRVHDVTGRAENSARIDGTPQSRIQRVELERVRLTLERWTKYPGRVFDNRPTTAIPDLEPHDTVGFSIRHADQVTLRDCSVKWGENPPDYFSHAVQAEDVTGLELPGFEGTSAHPDRQPAIVAPGHA